ncbi:antitermination protein NusG [Sorangium cellulosum]|uniref:Transcription termination/antitermination protein NusG n=2 Tax=Sorangium cellulosum TaxID=56 RepID=A0A150PN98_SORCE|nr:transcription termination/antitermination protein NusG [Sorangium cellulosum]AGP32730.1 transcription antitermination protein NusG [Sorangium cellulosum So0157-2]KYF57123.1 antitermination protein NusG [Sorangium cellulosum]KYG11136.1 antitermination protein NusG [Sorangium cellulosum]
MKKWYVIQTYLGFETKVRDALHQRFRQHGLESALGEILIPSEAITEPASRSSGAGVKPRRTFPGYIFAELEMNDRAFDLVKGTPRVVRFLGDRAPRQVSRAEIEAVRRGFREGALKPRPRVAFAVGDAVRVNEGPFANFTGTVASVDPDKRKVKVTISIFGRPTAIALDTTAVGKLEGRAAA